MGYERSTGRYYRDYGDRRYGPRDRDDYRERDYRDYRARSWDYDRPRDYDDDRGFFDRAGDEVRSWFGDEEAERRRRWDERVRQREYDRRYGEGDGGGYEGGRYTGARVGGAGGSYGGAGFYDSPEADYGVGRGAGATSTWGLGAGRAHDGWGLDPNYRAWRRRQLAELDRDYEDYRRENEARFHNDFGSWRSNRQSQRESLRHVQEHQEVVGSDGTHIGTVDHVRGDRILLTKGDRDAGGHHHSVPCAWIAEVSDKVTLNRTAAQAQAAWKDEERSEGPHYLDRAFAGTY
ncbi:SWFGD domain-containing protein [Sphingomonas sp. C8-2]|jgi:hypothetical protein|uniref:DUF2171 domain-containing protein n=1 Tax=Rhizorhabdus histidinilytica TaxID=439228 RepID=A0A1T5FNC0_9SPHN|nr:SWFGD domain-containing protein [Rhizorhabdus histidinilytica]QEH79896.1 SWFGD domain-containing protein [Sphingomonas sp. C8-2]SKB97608.1 hypothetical protein SAMN06295920_11063 [Rhizorhabdus histidinilytica]